MKLVLLLVAVVMICSVVGCAYHPKVPMPGDNAAPDEWKAFYKDQFKAYGDKVPPPDAQASLDQRVAYDDAKRSYHHKKTIGMVMMGCAFLIALGSFVGTMSQL